MSEYIKTLNQKVFENIISNNDLSPYVDVNFEISEILQWKRTYQTNNTRAGPTTKEYQIREKIKVTLNLITKQGQIRRYVKTICTGLGIDIDKNLYATNCLKNFFISPPTTIMDINIFDKFFPYWQVVLNKELEMLPNITITTLGEPILSVLLNDGCNKQ